MDRRNIVCSRVRLFAFTLTLSVCILFSISTAYLQTKTPYDKERLLKVVKLNALSTQEIVQAIESRGVNFQMTADIEAEFKQAGARPELVEAMRRNYRAAANNPAPPSPPPANPPSTPTRPAANVPAGPPLSEQEIITLLQSGVGAARVEQFVEVRGVSFALTPEVSRKITAAGGTNSLLGAIVKRAPADSARASKPNTPNPPRNVNRGPDYDELTDQAISAMQANNVNSATRLLQQAITLDASRPTAYQLFGFAELYGNRNITTAESFMRKALDHNGSATFRVYHDHDGYFKSYCQGTLFVTRTGVTFKADDGRDTFETTDAKIKEVDTNDFVGVQYGAFHIKVYMDEAQKKTKTFNFAPATQKKEESRLIINLIKSY